MLLVGVGVAAAQQLSGELGREGGCAGAYLSLLETRAPPCRPAGIDAIQYYLLFILEKSGAASPAEPGPRASRISLELRSHHDEMIRP